MASPFRLARSAVPSMRQRTRLQAGWFNSKRAVRHVLRKQADANVIETVDRMKAILPQLERWLPPAIHLRSRAIGP